ncbi:unnamed protein product [Caenorhabditis nigoni]
MSSGLPQLLSAAPPAANGFNLPISFNAFPYIFGPGGQPVSNLQTSGGSVNNRYKQKRHRQRVDAGEPRNTYQGMSSNTSTSSTSSTSSSTSSSHSSKTPLDLALVKTEMISTSSPPLQMENDSKSFNESDEAQEIEAMKAENDAALEEQDEIDADYEEEINHQIAEDGELDTLREESPDSNGSSSSASKRKSFQPQKIGEELGIELGEETEQINVTVGGASEDVPDDVPEETDTKEFSALQAQLQNGTQTDQQKFYAAFLEQQKKRLMAAHIAQSNKLNTENLMSMLKGEVVDNLFKNFEKIIKEWAQQEVLKNQEATTAPPQMPIPQPAPFHPLFPPNPLFHMPPPPHPMNSGGGIFPPNFNAFNVFSALRRPQQDGGDEPKRKRTRIDVKKEDVASSSRASPISVSASPPLARFYPAPTMVGHHFGAMHFGDRENSPTNSDELSDCGFEGNGSSSMLTPMHLRKAKLMFFYTRYPSSNLLKSYFPDIRFNKNNTAQLVKWFSNFREFYYIQMEKFARQALSEGISDRSEIFVSKDSELFKVLNTHYNRNNHIKAPDRLVLVVQETLREFYDAIKLGKDAEPSWKKTIYKIINRLDDQIPDFFKEPNFLERLES